MVLDDERLKARIHFDERDTLKELDKVLKMAQNALKKKKFQFKDFFAGDEGTKLNIRMVKILQDYAKTLDVINRREESSIRLTKEKNRLEIIQRDIKNKGIEERIAKTKELNKLERETIRRENIGRRYRGILEQVQEGSYKERNYAPGSYGDTAQRMYSKKAPFMEANRVNGNANRLYTFMAQLKGSIPGVEAQENTNVKAARFQRKMNPLISSGKAMKEGIGSKIPTLVKLAGFTMGMAGAAQFGKMVIDSSPMLQAMLKIVSTGFTFILRPIGDMMGLIIRPLSILMLRYAVQFYKSTLKYFPVWNKLGEGIAQYITGQPGEGSHTLGEAIKEFQLIAGKSKAEEDGVITPQEQAKLDEMQAALDAYRNLAGAQKSSGKELPLDIVGLLGGTFVKPFTDFFKQLEVENEHGMNFWDKLTVGFDRWWKENTFGGSAYAEEGGFLPGGQQGPMYPGSVIGPDGKTYLPAPSAGGEGEIVPKNNYGGYGSKSAQDKALEETLAETKRKYPHLFDQPGSEGSFSGYMKPIDKVIEEGVSSGLYANPDFETGGYTGGYTSTQRKAGLDRMGGALGINQDTQVGDLPGLIATADIWDEVEDITKVIKNTSFIGMDRETQAMLATVKRMKAAGETELTFRENATEAMKASYDKMKRVLHSLKIQSRKDNATSSQRNLGSTADANQSVIINESGGHGAQLSGFRGNNGKVYSSAFQAIMNNGPPPDYQGAVATDISSGQKYRWSTVGNGSVIPFAKGGIINEPILGLGKSGQKYLFGEAGPEKVTPMGQSGGSSGGNNYNITFNLSGVKDADDFERKVMPMVRRALKEDHSRRGIL